MAGLHMQAVLADPHDPEVLARASEWQPPQERDQLEERQAEPRRPAQVKAPEPVASVRGGYGNTVVTYQVFEETMRTFAKSERANFSKRLGPHLEAIVEAMFKTFESARTKTTWRFEEAERRIADLEARLAKMEGDADG